MADFFLPRTWVNQVRGPLGRIVPKSAIWGHSACRRIHGPDNTPAFRPKRPHGRGGGRVEGVPRRFCWTPTGPLTGPRDEGDDLRWMMASGCIHKTTKNQ